MHKLFHICTQLNICRCLFSFSKAFPLEQSNMQAMCEMNGSVNKLLFQNLFHVCSINTYIYIFIKLTHYTFISNVWIKFGNCSINNNYWEQKNLSLHVMTHSLSCSFPCSDFTCSASHFSYKKTILNLPCLKQNK
jgi:hypothetical protein